MGPLPILTAGMMLGVALGMAFDLQPWVAAVATAAAIAATVVMTARGSRASFWLAILGSLLLGGFLGGRSAIDGPGEALPPLPCGAAVEGLAYGDAVASGDEVRFDLRVRSVRVPAKDVGMADSWIRGSARGNGGTAVLRVLSDPAGAMVSEGDRILLRGSYFTGRSGYLNPGVRQRRTRAVTTVKARDASGVVVAGRGGPLERMRAGLAARQAATLPPDVAAIAEAVTTGRTDGIPREAREAFRRSGTSHLLAVSGLHLALIAMGASRIARLAASRVPPIAERIPAQGVAAVVAVATSWAFAAFASGNAPVVRAAVMVSAALASRMAGRASSPLASLSLAAAAIVVADPGAMVTPSFVLSFSAVAGLFAFSGRIRALAVSSWTALGRAMEGTGGTLAARAARAVLREVVGGACVSCAATMGTLPGVAWFFGEVPVSGLIANVAAVPLFGFLVLPSVVVHAVACSAWLPAGRLVAPVVVRSTGILMRVVSLASLAPLAPAGGVAGAASCLGLVAAVLLALRSRARAAACVAAASLTLLVSAPAIGDAWRDRAVDGRLTVFFLDSGMGDAAVVRSPGGGWGIVDAGPAHPFLGSRGPLPEFLRSWGADSIDVAVISHAHSDHWGGLLDLEAASIRVGEVVTASGSDDPDADAGWPDLLAALASGGTRITHGPPCGPIRGFPVEAAILHPCDGDLEGHPAGENDRSIAMAVGARGACVLFTGDIGTPVEETVAARAAPLRCPVLKVPHHGSAGSSGEAILATSGLELAVLSARSGNSFGLPHASALSRILSSGLRLHRIDLDGGLLVSFLHGDLEVMDAQMEAMEARAQGGQGQHESN